MLTTDIKHKIDTARDILVGKVPDPKAQVDQITNALIYKFMDDMDQEAVELGGKQQFFNNGYEKYAWSKLMDPKLGGLERLNLYVEAITKLSQNPHIPQLFRDIFKDAYLPYRDPETLSLFLKQINEFTYHHSEELGNSFEYLLSVLGSQGDAGQFRTPRHIIDFIVSVVDPKKTDRILDPACGTAGFLISAYKHILASHDGKDEVGKPNEETRLTPDERKRLVKSIVGYDISPDMVKLSRVNMYLHGFPEPHISEYDTLTSDDRWDDSFDVILANPPFMSPKGGIRPHKRFSVQANRAEVLFVDYIAEHLTTTGRAGVIVPEGVIFQSGASYKQLRKMLVENYLYAVVSLPTGVFQPYSGVKTSILFFDPSLAKGSNILFLKIENDGRTLGSQRKPQEGNQLDPAKSIITEFKLNPEVSGEELKKIASSRPAFTIGKSLIGGIDAIGNPAEISSLKIEVVSRDEISESGDYNLMGDRYSVSVKSPNQHWPNVRLDEIFLEIKNGKNVAQVDEVGRYKVSRIQTIANGRVDLAKTKYTNDEVNENDFLNEGDILFSHINSFEHLAKTAIFSGIQEKVVHGANLIRLRPDPSRVLPKYALFVFKSDQFVSEARRFAQKAVNQASINSTAIKSLEIPIPPLEIQKEIVTELDGYQKIVDAARTIAQSYKPVIKSDPSWKVAELTDVTDFQEGPGIMAVDFHKDGVPLVRLKGLKGPIASLDGCNYLDPNKVDKKWNHFRLKEGDLLLSTSGTLGRVSEVTGAVSGSIAYTGIIRFRPLSNLVDRGYLKYFLLSDFFTSQAQSMKTGGVLQHFGPSHLKKMKILLPPIEVQQRIARQTADAENVVRLHEEMAAEYEDRIKDRIGEVWS